MTTVLHVLSWTALASGSLVILVASFGVVRLPDYYSRTHAASVTDTLGAGLFLIGLILQAIVADAGLVAVAKLCMIFIFLVLTGPPTAHALARTALAHGLRLPPLREFPEEEER